MKSIYYPILLVVLLLATSCQDTVYQKVAGNAQGTTYHIIYNKDEMLKSQIDSVLEEIDLSVSSYNPEAILYKVNANIPDTKVDNHFKNVFDKAMEISRQTDGFFDITVGPLITLYGFYGKPKGDITPENIDSLLQFVGFNKVKIENDKLIKENENIKIDMNALAQGYSVDYIADFFEKKGINNYLIEVGGETICKGKNEYGEAWRIGIERPMENTEINDRQIELIVELKDTKKALATSGNYRKFFVENGVKYTHSVNPKTGYPSRDSLISVTILANDCMTADGYATACLVSGYERAVKIVEKIPDIEAFFIYFDQNGNYQFYFSKGFKKYVAE